MSVGAHPEFETVASVSAPESIRASESLVESGAPRSRSSLRVSGNPASNVSNAMSGGRDEHRAASRLDTGDGRDRGDSLVLQSAKLCGAFWMTGSVDEPTVEMR